VTPSIPRRERTLTMRSERQLVATSGNGFGLFEPFGAAIPFATGCYRLRPLCFTTAPSTVVSRGSEGRPEEFFHIQPVRVRGK
jgi:hypothetical protein